MPKKHLRTGYTTGACAAAAAKAAALALLEQRPIDCVDIQLPVGCRATFAVARCRYGPEQAFCSVIKDAGDDPDVTHGAEICATVAFHNGQGLILERGEGVGMVTKPGLGLPVGSPAINPVPRQMIASSLCEAMSGTGKGFRLVISVPGGERLALRTLNPRLGIVGGLSILGTTGIVVPFSSSAYQTCIQQALDVALAAGLFHVVLTTGRRSERFAQRIVRLPEEGFIQMGDFVSFALRECGRRGIRKVTICGMVGKLSKIAAGYGQTHACHSRIDRRFLSDLATASGLSEEVVAQIDEMNTARRLAEVAMGERNSLIFTNLCRLAAERAYEWTGRRSTVEIVMVDFEGGVLGRAEVGG